jgi:hypothetical protein
MPVLQCGAGWNPARRLATWLATAAGGAQSESEGRLTIGCSLPSCPTGFLPFCNTVRLLCFVDYLAALESRDADRAARLSKVDDCIFSDPKIARSEESPESCGLAGMMTAQSLRFDLR